MVKTTGIVASSAPLVALPAVAANGTSVVGMNSVGPAMFMFTLALALLLTLVFRSTANHMAQFITVKFGQWRIRRILKKCSPDVLHDFILPGAYGGLSKLDHAVLTNGGILCIQSKHCSGIIFGDEKEPQWTNVDGVRRSRFLNPTIQNEGRTKALRKIVPDVPIVSLVTFTGAVEFTSPLAANVIHVRDLEKFVAAYDFGASDIQDWDAVWLSVKAAALTDVDTRKDFHSQLGFF